MRDAEGPADGEHRPVGVSDLAHLDFARRVILPAARARRLLPDGQDAAWTDLLRDLTAEASGAPAPAATQSSGPTIHTSPSRVASSSTGSSAAAVYWQALRAAGQPAPASSIPPQPPGPGGQRHTRAGGPPRASALRQWWSRTLEAMGSDLAVHGLAYLGVLLFLVGAFGLVAFAFGDVSPELRPVAEIVIAIAPFAAGVILRRRNANVVGRALELAGGLILPIMLGTAFLDGVALPPDFTGTALAIVLTAVTAAVALAYAAWTWRHPDTALRYLVAPMGWLTVGMATLGVGREIPIGKAVATPSVAQVAFMALALAVSTLWARLRPEGRLAAPTLVAALPGLVVLGVLAPLVWSADANPPVYAVLLTGVALLVGLECVQGRLASIVPAIVEPVWWAVVWLALVGSVGLGGTDGAIVSLLTAAGFVAILEVANAGRRPIPARTLPAVGLVLPLLAS